MTTALHMTFQPYGNQPAFTIEVNSVSFDAEQTLNIGSQSSGAGAGKVTFNPISFTKKPDGHSADLWARLCSGTPFQKVSFDATILEKNIPVMSFTMGLVGVKTISLASQAEGVPLEVVTLAYGQAGYSVTPQNPDGSVGKPVASAWDRIKNVAIDPARVGVV